MEKKDITKQNFINAYMLRFLCYKKVQLCITFDYTFIDVKASQYTELLLSNTQCTKNLFPACYGISLYVFILNKYSYIIHVMLFSQCQDLETSEGEYI